MAIGKKTGGRVAGTPNKTTAAKIAEIEASGLTPLDFMLSVLRDIDKPVDVRMDAAKSAAPYIHPRLNAVSVELSGPEGDAIPHSVEIKWVRPADAGEG